MLRKAHRWMKRLVLPMAALPVMTVTGGCDSLVAAGASQLATSVFSTTVASVHSVLVQNFPSADLLQVLLGANPSPFFP